MAIGGKKVDKAMVAKLESFYKGWRFAVDNNMVNRGNASQNLENYIKSNMDAICESLLAVAELEARLASYEALIKELSSSKKTKIGTPEDASVQTAVVDPNTDSDAESEKVTRS